MSPADADTVTRALRYGATSDEPATADCAASLLRAVRDSANILTPHEFDALLCACQRVAIRRGWLVGERRP